MSDRQARARSSAANCFAPCGNGESASDVRIGKQPVRRPRRRQGQGRRRQGRVEGPKGKLELAYHRNMKVESRRARQSASTSRGPTTSGSNRSLHGLTRSLIANMVEGVTKGYEKKLKIEGIGYQARMDKKAVVLTVGYANAIKLDAARRRDGRGARPDHDRGQGRRQAEGRPVRRRSAGRPQAGAVQGQGHPLRKRSRSAARKASRSPAAVDHCRGCSR